jgi:hypothetical protein
VRRKRPVFEVDDHHQPYAALISRRLLAIESLRPCPFVPLLEDVSALAVRLCKGLLRRELAGRGPGEHGRDQPAMEISLIAALVWPG